MSADTNRSGFVIDEVPGSDQYTWTLLGTRGETLARAPKAYDTRQEAQVAIAEVKVGARTSEVPTHSEQTIGA